jgi:hypothetical protein
MSNPAVPPAAAPAPAPAPDPNTTIVIIAPNGDVYELTEAQWTAAGQKVVNDQALLLPNEVRAVNAYIAFPPNDGAGVGLTCTIVNLQAVLANQRALASAKARGAGAAPSAAGAAAAGPAAAAAIGRRS